MENIELDLSSLNINIDHKNTHRIDLSYFILALFIIALLYYIYQHNRSLGVKDKTPLFRINTRKNSLNSVQKHKAHYKPPYNSSSLCHYDGACSHQPCHVNPIPEYIPDIIPFPHLSIQRKLGEMAGMNISTHSGRIVAAPFRNPFCY